MCIRDRPSRALARPRGARRGAARDGRGEQDDERPCRGDGDDLAPLSVLPHLLSPFYPVCLSAQVNELIPVDILQTSPGLGSWM